MSPPDLLAPTDSDRFGVGTIIGRQKSFEWVEKLKVGSVTGQLMVGICGDHQMRTL
jgi:hypothetical protein